MEYTRQYLQTLRKVLHLHFIWKGEGSQIKLVLILEKKDGRVNSWRHTVRQNPQGECNMVVFALKERMRRFKPKYHLPDS